MVECRLQYRLPDESVKLFSAQGITESEAYTRCMHQIMEELRTAGKQLDLTRILRPPGPQYTTS